MSVLFLFGAGASYGSEKKSGKSPSMGDHLFLNLRDRFPESWGKLASDFEQLFQCDFELAMNEVLLKNSREIGLLQRDMARYFLDFFPTKNNLYIKLMKSLLPQIENISLATLNYDRLLEEACLSLGIISRISEETRGENKLQVEICYPHGASNIFLSGMKFPKGTLSFPYDSGIFDSKVEIVRDSKIAQKKLQDDDMPPVMACFNQKKTSAVGKKFLENQRVKFEQMVQSAELIVIIGVQMREHDNHIWSPLKKADAKIVYCSGSGEKGFKSWTKKFRIGKNDECLLGYFFDQFDKLCEIANDSLAKC